MRFRAPTFRYWDTGQHSTLQWIRRSPTLRYSDTGEHSSLQQSRRAIPGFMFVRETSIYSHLLMLTGVVALLLRESFSNNSCSIIGQPCENLVEPNSTFHLLLRRFAASGTADGFRHGFFGLSSKGGDSLLRPPHLPWVSFSFKGENYSHLPADYIATDLQLITITFLDQLQRWGIIKGTDFGDRPNTLGASQFPLGQFQNYQVPAVKAQWCTIHQYSCTIHQYSCTIRQYSCHHLSVLLCTIRQHSSAPFFSSVLHHSLATILCLVIMLFDNSAPSNNLATDANTLCRLFNCIVEI